MKNKLNETGRSMVEMLGVLAVIGVLSVGGIMGYKFAMDKYQANQTVNDINLRALDILIQQSEQKLPTSMNRIANFLNSLPKLPVNAISESAISLSSCRMNFTCPICRVPKVSAPTSKSWSKSTNLCSPEVNNGRFSVKDFY